MRRVGCATGFDSGLPPTSSVVALEDNLFAVPSEAGQAVADGRDHVVEAGDVGVDVEVQLRGRNGQVGGRLGQRLAEAGRAFLNDAGHVVLHVTAQAAPALRSAAQRGQVVKVGMAARQGLEIVAVVELGLMAGAVNQPDVFTVAAIGAV